MMQTQEKGRFSFHDSKTQHYELHPPHMKWWSGVSPLLTLDQCVDLLGLVPLLVGEAPLTVDVLLADVGARDADGVDEHGRVDQDHEDHGGRKRPDQTALVVKPAAEKNDNAFG